MEIMLTKTTSHLELFHHFAHATARTLCFEEVWPLMLSLAVHVRRLTLA